MRQVTVSEIRVCGRQKSLSKLFADMYKPTNVEEKEYS